MRRLSATELDQIGRRLEDLAEMEERLRTQLKEQIKAYGSTPPRAEKSKRLEGQEFQFTLSTSIQTVIKDAEVERIKAACPAAVFKQLFVESIRYKLYRGATFMLSGTLPEGAPSNLRKMFAAAVEQVETEPRLTVKKLDEVAEPA